MSESYWQAPEVNEKIFILGEQPSPTESIDDAVAVVVPNGAEFSISILCGIAAVELPLNSDNLQIAKRKDGNISLAICVAGLKVRKSK